MSQTDVTPDNTADTRRKRPCVGAMNKPFSEKLKLLFVFALVGAGDLFFAAYGAVFNCRLCAGDDRQFVAHLGRWPSHAQRAPRGFRAVRIHAQPILSGALFVHRRLCGAWPGVGFDLSATPITSRLTGIFVVAIIGFFVVYMPRKEQREGDRLLEIFGEEYATYRKNVPPLFPRLTPFRTNPRPWSKDLFLGHEPNLRRQQRALDDNRRGAH